MAGRKPKPTAIKKLEGNPGKRKLNENFNIKMHNFFQINMLTFYNDSTCSSVG